MVNCLLAGNKRWRCRISDASSSEDFADHLHGFDTGEALIETLVTAGLIGATSTVPASGWTKPSHISTVVVLPAPFGPITPTIPPGGSLVALKHQSAWETIAFLQIFPKDLCYVFKRELLWIPFFGWVIGLLNMIHINRSDTGGSAISVANQGKERLKAGKWMIFRWPALALAPQ